MLIMTNIRSRLREAGKRWFIDALSGMALGLFATLIVGTIFEQFGKFIGVETSTGSAIIQIAGISKILMGAGIGAGIASMLKADKLVVFSCIVAGMTGANAQGYLGEFALNPGIGNPVGAYLATICAVEASRLVSGRTKMDIVLVPLTVIVVGGIAALSICPPAAWLISQIATGIEFSMRWNPFVMGIVIAVVMGCLLTLPTSSAAIWISIVPLLDPSPEMLLAGGAAVSGCAAHMIGFAVMSYKENGVAGLLSQGLGTSMLQIPNIVRNPRILLPPLIASVIVGPLSTCVFRLQTGAIGGGMGTSGLVGVFNTIDYSQHLSPFRLVSGIGLLLFILPALVSWSSAAILKKAGWIKEGDMKLDFSA